MDSVRRAAEQRIFGRPLEELRAASADHPVLARCWRLLDARFLDETLHLGIAERHCGVDRSYLNRLLRQRTGHTFHQLRTGLRLALAVERLLGSDESILEIALDVGFGSLRTFQRNFRQAFGCTAGEVRRRRCVDL